MKIFSRCDKFGIWQLLFFADLVKGRNAWNFDQCVKSTLSVDPQSSCCVRNEYFDPIISPSKYVVRVGWSSVKPVRILLNCQISHQSMIDVTYPECVNNRIKMILSYPHVWSQPGRHKSVVLIVECRETCYQAVASTEKMAWAEKRISTSEADKV